MKYSIKLVLLLLLVSLHASKGHAQELTVSKHSREPLIVVHKDLVVFMLGSDGDLLYVTIKEVLYIEYNLDEQIIRIGDIEIDYDIRDQVRRFGREDIEDNFMISMVS